MNKLEEWKNKLTEQEQSGMTQSDWSVEDGISLSKFRYWKRKTDRAEAGGNLASDKAGQVWFERAYGDMRVK